MTLNEGTNGFVVYCDTSWDLLGCALMKKCKDMTNGSSKLKVHDKNYRTHYIGVVVVVFAFKKMEASFLWGLCGYF